MAAWVERIACAALLRAAVEREELRRLARELRRHRDQLRIDREVDDRAARERHVLRVTVAPVLGDRVLDALARERVLQLCGRDGDPVQEEREIQSLRLVRRVRELPDEHEPVRLVARDELRRQPVRRLEVREPDLDAEILDPVPEHVDRAALVELAREPLEEVRSRRLLAAVAGAELAPRVRLRRLDECERPRRDRARARGRRCAGRLSRSRRARAATPRSRPRTSARSRRSCGGLRDVEFASNGGGDQRLPALAQEGDLRARSRSTQPIGTRRWPSSSRPRSPLLVERAEA